MKMKFIIGILSFLGLFAKIQGQSGFLDSTYIWTEFNFGGWPPSGSTTRHTFASTTTELNGKQYYERLSSSSPSGDDFGHTEMFYRADESGKVYLSYNGIIPFERPIYDYGLSVNDTFRLQNFSDLIVDHIDTIQLENGEFRKRMAMRCALEDYIGDYWIEGLGGIAGVYDVYHQTCAIDGENVSTLCISRNDTLIYDHPDFDSCWLAPVATNDLMRDLISLYPNPASTDITISSKDQSIQNATIVDLLGNVIPIRNTSPIDVGFLPPGYYFLRIELKNQQIVMKQFVKQ